MHDVAQHKAVCASTRFNHGRKVQKMFYQVTLRRLGSGEQLHALSRSNLDCEGLK